MFTICKPLFFENIPEEFEKKRLRWTNNRRTAANDTVASIVFLRRYLNYSQNAAFICKHNTALKYRAILCQAFVKLLHVLCWKQQDKLSQSLYEDLYSVFLWIMSVTQFHNAVVLSNTFLHFRIIFRSIFVLFTINISEHFKISSSLSHSLYSDYSPG